MMAEGVQLPEGGPLDVEARNRPQKNVLAGDGLARDNTPGGMSGHRRVPDLQQLLRALQAGGIRTAQPNHSAGSALHQFKQ